MIIKGPVDSPFEGYDLLVDFDFPEQFPFKFPAIKFKTNIWHPNVKDGKICEEMIGEKQWTPNKKVQEIVQALVSMLLEPDLHHPINHEAANEFKEGKYEQHVKEVLEKTGAQKSQTQWLMSITAILTFIFWEVFLSSTWK